MYIQVARTINLIHFFNFILAFDFYRLLTPQRPMTSDFEGFSIPDFIHYIYFPILILEKEPVLSLLNVQAIEEVVDPNENTKNMLKIHILLD